MSISRLKDQRLLGVAGTATRKEIRRRYLELCKKHHPDVAKSTDGPDIRDITAAYNRLIGKDNYSPSSSANNAAWREASRQQRKEATYEEQTQWTKHTLFAGLAFALGVWAYTVYEPELGSNDDLLAATYPIWNPQQQHPEQGRSEHFNYRQWRKS
ncbi:hypothetical protein BX666DRAFT_1565271 [Dichotomocladium elegans]|nr:hypothetical protein BX666DRAFT_1565271 [Dichotomocladium elegans]